jgi:hypothetical protein
MLQLGQPHKYEHGAPSRQREPSTNEMTDQARRIAYGPGLAVPLKRVIDENTELSVLFGPQHSSRGEINAQRKSPAVAGLRERADFELVTAQPDPLTYGSDGPLTNGYLPVLRFGASRAKGEEMRQCPTPGSDPAGSVPFCFGRG